MHRPINHTTETELEALKELLRQSESKLQETQFRLEEATDMLEAIRNGEVDALVVKGEDGHSLYTLKSSDQVYRIFIEQMTTGAATLNRRNSVLYCNSRLAELLEMPLEKVSGTAFCDFVSAADRGECLAVLEKAWQHKGMKQEVLMSTSAGNEVPVLLSMQPLEMDEGVFMSVIITDLTAQKRQQQQLHEQNLALQEAQRIARELNSNLEKTVRERTQELYNNQERLGRILETMAEGVTIIDINGKLVYANRMAQKVLGIKPEDTNQKYYAYPQWDRFCIDGSPFREADDPMIRAMQTGKPVQDFEICIQPPAKERFYISINAAPVRDEKGEIVGSIGTFTDVTHRRKSIQQKDDFISVASHELRTPIATLKASLQLLQRIKDNPESPMFGKLIDQSAKSLNKVSVLINDLLDTRKMTEGQLQLNRTKFLVKPLIDDCCHHIRAVGTYEIVYEGDETIMVEADRDKIDQVLVNLVNNAVKYAPQSKVIRVAVVRDGQFACIRVIDNGHGIPPDKLDNLFERYYRLHTGGNNASGLGLGLYISSEIIRKHGGRIGVKSEVGEGSAFWFTLPLA